MVNEVTQNTRQMLELEDIFGEFAYRVKLVEFDPFEMEIKFRVITIIGNSGKMGVDNIEGGVPITDVFEIIDSDEVIYVSIISRHNGGISFALVGPRDCLTLRVGSSKNGIASWFTAIFGSSEIPIVKEISIETEDRIQISIKNNINVGNRLTQNTIPIHVDPNMTIKELMDGVFNKGIKNHQYVGKPNKLECWVEMRFESYLDQ